jgi:uncharacterized membrane protein YuzA (DUF378 family)
MRKIDVAGAALLIIGGLHWGLVGLAAVYQVTQLRALPARWGARRPAMAS